MAEAAVQGCVMNGIVEGVIADVTEQKGGKEYWNKLAWKNKRKQKVKEDRQRKADGRRHYQPRRIVWIIVMDSVSQEMDSLPPGA